MKFPFSVILVYTFLLANCSDSSSKVKTNENIVKEESLTGQGTQKEVLDTSGPAYLLSLNDAEKIIGVPAHLKDSASIIKDNVTIFNSTFTANAWEKSTGKTANIYFMYEQYPFDTAAKRVFTSIKRSNQNHGIKVLHDLGDEAYFHSDNQNFYFIMVRKGSKMIRMKVNKITSSTSLDSFYLIANKITSSL
jgi:hypothetical protein